MAMIYVKAREGRKAFYEGRIIPSDKFVAVTDDPYIRRLVDHWGDLEVEGGDQKDATPAPAPRQRNIEKGPTPPVAGGGRRTVQPTVTQAPGTGAPKPTDPPAQS